ncbi:CdaR family protein [Paenibacillus sp. PL2-23]|uniref:CdaR family protein n=1 Tax=Paenibacillus sp. PL2-23 TaxID=2100729 RepID=UPI0030FB2C4A
MDKWLSHPTALKIISVLLGVLLFAVVHIDPETAPQATVSSVDTSALEAVTIEPIGLDEEKYVLTAMEPTVVRLVVEGSISNLRKNTPLDYVVNVDLTNVKPGIQELPLTLKLPKGIEEVELSPRQVTVQIEEIVSKTFDAQVIIEGQPAEGYVAGTPQVLSEGGNVVGVTLPRDDMDKVGLVAVTMNVEGAVKSVENKKAKIVVYDTEGQEISNAIVQPSTLHVETKITRPYKQVPVQIRYTGTLADNLSLVSVTPEMDQVTVYAEQSVLDTITVYGGAVLDLSKVKQSGTVKVKTTPVDGIEAVNPAELELAVIVEGTTTKRLSNLPITIIGTEDGMTADIASPASGTIDLVIGGAESVLRNVSAEDVTVIAKIDGLEAGTHTIALELELPSYVQPILSEGQTLSATVEILDESASADEQEELEVGGAQTEPPDGDRGDSGSASGGSSGDGETDAASGNGGTSGNAGGALNEARLAASGQSGRVTAA